MTSETMTPEEKRLIMLTLYGRDQSSTMHSRSGMYDHDRGGGRYANSDAAPKPIKPGDGEKYPRLPNTNWTNCPTPNSEATYDASDECGNRWMGEPLGTPAEVEAAARILAEREQAQPMALPTSAESGDASLGSDTGAPPETVVRPQPPPGLSSAQRKELSELIASGLRPPEPQLKRRKL